MPQEFSRRGRIRQNEKVVVRHDKCVGEGGRLATKVGFGRVQNRKRVANAFLPLRDGRECGAP